MKRMLLLALLAVLGTGGLSCGGDATASGPGTLKVRLIAPAATLDSAIIFTISGPAALTSVTAGTGLRLFQQPLGGTSTRLALVGPLTNGATLVTVGVRSLADLTLYSGSIEGVAMPTDQLRVLPGGYALAITR